MGGKRRLCLKERIQQGKLRREDVMRGLGQLAFGKVNDCVKLALEEQPDLDSLDLTLLCEVKKTEKGLVEVKLIDRLKVMEQLAKVVGGDQKGAQASLQALQNGEAEA